MCSCSCHVIVVLLLIIRGGHSRALVALLNDFFIVVYTVSQAKRVCHHALALPNQYWSRRVQIPTQASDHNKEHGDLQSNAVSATCEEREPSQRDPLPSATPTLPLRDQYRPIRHVSWRKAGFQYYQSGYRHVTIKCRLLLHASLHRPWLTQSGGHHQQRHHQQQRRAAYRSPENDFARGYGWRSCRQSSSWSQHYYGINACLLRI